MYKIIKRDGKIVDFDITKIANAIKKAFEATDTEYTDDTIDFIALKVSADFLPKIKDGYVAVMLDMITKDLHAEDDAPPRENKKSDRAFRLEDFV